MLVARRVFYSHSKLFTRRVQEVRDQDACLEIGGDGRLRAKQRMDESVFAVHTSFTMDSKLERLHYGLEMETQGALWLEGTCPSLRLLEKNYRWKGGEIDLIFEDRFGGDLACELVFVEVRARKLGALVDGVVSITAPKQRRLSRTIRHYLARYRGSAKSIRFDVLTWNGLNWSHLKNVRLEDQGIARYH